MAGQHASNGNVERTVQSVDECLRTVKSSLDSPMPLKVDVLPPMLTWSCEFVGCTRNRMEAASDGETPHKRVGEEGGGRGRRLCASSSAKWGCNSFLGGEVQERGVDRRARPSKEMKCAWTVPAPRRDNRGAQTT